MRFGEEVERANVQRARIICALLAVVHVAVALSAPRGVASASPAERDWAEMLATLHAVWAPVSLLTLVAVALPDAKRPKIVDRFVGEWITAIYLTLGIAVTLNAQRIFASNFNGYLLAAFAAVAIFRVRIRALVAIHALGVAAFGVALTQLELSDATRVSLSVNAFAVSLIAAGLGASLATYARRTSESRLALEMTQEELRRLNAELESRVAAQVQEIVERSNEVERLNAQLRQNVASRSRELSRALERLARLEGWTPELPAGTVLGERVEIGELIGVGGMGAVYKGRDLASGESVAVKVLHPRTKDVAALQRFLLEARAAASVSHEAIARTVHLDVSEDGQLFQVQELVIGHLLHTALQARTERRLELACRVGEVLSSALAAAHAQGVVHRDVKPANVMVTATPPGLKLLDFGVSRLSDAGDSSVTREGDLVGTPSYMAPEQVSDPSRAGERVDVYAVALVVFEIAAGRKPFESTSSLAVLNERVTATPARLDRFVPDAPGAIVALLERSLSADPDARPSARELSDALGRIAGERAAPSLPELVSALAISTPSGEGRAPRAPAPTAVVRALAVTRDERAESTG